MALPSSNSRVVLVALTTPDAQGAITYHFDINGSPQHFDAHFINKGGIQAVEMSEPLEKMLQQMLPIVPQIAKTLVDVTLKIANGEYGGLPLELLSEPKA